MITVREFRNLINIGPEDFKRVFRKWEHGKPEDFMKRNHYPMPNLVSVKIQEITSRCNDMGGKIYKIVMEDDFDYDFEMLPEEMIKFFCEGKNDDDLLDFVLYTEDTPGHYNHIPLVFSEGDTGYSDKIKQIYIDEII